MESEADVIWSSTNLHRENNRGLQNHSDAGIFPLLTTQGNQQHTAVFKGQTRTYLNQRTAQPHAKHTKGGFIARGWYYLFYVIPSGEYCLLPRHKANRDQKKHPWLEFLKRRKKKKKERKKLASLRRQWHFFHPCNSRQGRCHIWWGLEL